MAYALDGENDLDDLLSCPVCQEHFTDPRMLQCGHSFCEKCIVQCLVKDGLPNGYKQICCPVCRMKQMLGLKQDAQTLPRNYAIAHITDHMREKNNMAATDKVYYCSFCNGSGYEVCFFCFDCGNNLCSACLEKHDICYQDHITVDVPDCNFSVFECEKHVQQKLKLYCSDCGTTICTHCHIVDHSGHATEILSRKLQSWHHDAQRSLSCLQEKQEKNASDISRISTELQTLHAVREQIIEQIKTRKQELIDKLDEQEIELITQVDKSFDDESEVINSVHEMANSKADELQRFMVSAHDMSDSASLLLHFLKSGLDIDGELLRIRDFAENKDTSCTIPTTTRWKPLMSSHPDADLGHLMFEDELRPCAQKSPPSAFHDDDIMSCSADLGHLMFDDEIELTACDRKSPPSAFSDNDIVSSKKNIVKECLRNAYSREELLQINQLPESKLEPTVLNECDCILPHRAAMKLQRTEVQFMDTAQPLETSCIVTHSDILQKRKKNRVLFGNDFHKDISVWRKE